MRAVPAECGGHMRKILILTNKEDIHADLVLRELKRRGRAVIRLHPDEFPNRITMTYKNGVVQVVIPDSKISFSTDEVGSVWYRRPRPPAIDSNIANQAARNFAATESSHFVENVYGCLEHAKWVNPYYAGRRARNKLLQMEVGKRHGLIFPRTIVSNDPEEMRAFFESCAGEVVYKSVRVGLLHDTDGSSRLIFTTRLTLEDIALLRGLRSAICIWPYAATLLYADE